MPWLFILYLIIAVVVVEASTELLVKSAIFKPLNKFLSSKGRFLEEMLSCGYCASVWISIIPAYLLSNLQEWISALVAFPFMLLFLHRSSNYLHNINDKYFDKYYRIKNE